MVLRTGYLLLAQLLQEAADMAHSDVRARLQDAIQDAHRGTGHYGSYVDHTGDGESGDVIYSCDGDLMKCPYTLGSVGGKATANLDTDDATNVVPVTQYQEEAEDSDYYTSMMEALKRGNIYTDLPLYERFIAKSERDKADDSDFAGKGRSFPILKASDVMAAVHAMGRAGSDNYSSSELKKRIITIAKRKGFTSELPKAWRDGTDASESARHAATGTLKLHETNDWTDSSLTLSESEASANVREIKVIAPGKGSSAFYPAEVLKRDGPGTFKSGTQIFINHATEAERRARPEGDWRQLAGALKTNAYWKESAKEGPGLYALAEFAPDHAPAIIAKAKYSGMSINAEGDAVMEAGRPKTKDGVPLLARLTGAESVDVVTRAGAGGMILTEAAHHGQTQQEAEMTAEETKRLIEAAVAPFRERAIRGEAREEAVRILSGISLPEAAKGRVIDEVLRDVPVAEGAIDLTKFRENLVAAAKREGTYLQQVTGSGRVSGLGAGAPLFQMSEADQEAERKLRKREAKEAKRDRKDLENVFEVITGNKDAAKFAARGAA